MRGIISCLVILALASGATAAFMDYQGGSAIMTAADWSEMNVTWDPTSTSAVAPHWPTSVDDVTIRNGATTTLNTFVEVNKFKIGGYAVLDTSGGVKQPMPASTLEIVSGGHLKAVNDFRIADAYDGTVNMYEGSMVELDESTVGDGKSWWYVGRGAGLNGQMNIYGGTVRTDASVYSNLYIGRDDSIGEVHQYGGLVDIHSPTKGYLYIGRDSGTGTGSYILEGGSFLHRNDTNDSRNYIGRYGGTSVWKQTGGYAWFGGSMNIGSSSDTKGISMAYASFLGGTTQVLSSIYFGGTHSTLLSPIAGGRITYGQDAVFQAGGGFGAYSNWTEMEFVIESAADFSVYFAQVINMDNLDIVVTVGAYVPTIGEQWIAMTSGIDVSTLGIQTVTTNLGGWLVIDDTVNNQLILEYVPEPATLTLLVLGGLALIRRRR